MKILQIGEGDCLTKESNGQAFIIDPTLSAVRLNWTSALNLVDGRSMTYTGHALGETSDHKRPEISIENSVGFGIDSIDRLHISYVTT